MRAVNECGENGYTTTQLEDYTFNHPFHLRLMTTHKQCKKRKEKEKRIRLRGTNQ